MKRVALHFTAHILWLVCFFLHGLQTQQQAICTVSLWPVFFSTAYGPSNRQYVQYLCGLSVSFSTAYRPSNRQFVQYLCGLSVSFSTAYRPNNRQYVQYLMAGSASFICWWHNVLQHASVSQGWIYSDNFTCCHTETEVADQTFHLTQSQYTDTGSTSLGTDLITPGAWQGN